MLHGWLLQDGRFAFGMMRFWGDLRKLLNLRMQHNGNLRPLFMMADGNYREYCMFRMMEEIGALYRPESLQCAH